ncbi:MAG: SCO family protein [Polyangiaceae bacterium]
MSLDGLRAWWLWLVLAVCVVARAQPCRAQSWQDNPGGLPNTTPPELVGVDIVEHLGQALPKDARFTDADGRSVTLGEFFDGQRPSVFVFAYHTCPMLCSLVLDATVRALSAISWTVGDQFDLISVSIDPHDTAQTATRKRDELVGRYARAQAKPAGWHFLVGDEANIRRVTEAVGFEYRYDAVQKQFAHPAAIYILSPEGRLARYLYGFQFDPNDVRLGLLEAAASRSITTTERLLLYCYHYDPRGKRYAIAALSVMRLGGAMTVVLIGGFVVSMLLRERRKRAQTPRAAASAPAAR